MEPSPFQRPDFPALEPDLWEAQDYILVIDLEEDLLLGLSYLKVPRYGCYLLPLAPYDTLLASMASGRLSLPGVTLPGSSLGQCTSGPWKPCKPPRSAKLCRCSSLPRSFSRLTLQACKPTTATCLVITFRPEFPCPPSSNQVKLLEFFSAIPLINGL